MPLGTLDRTPPPFFKQGPSALSKLMVFSALAVFLMVADHRFQLVAPVRSVIATALYPLQWLVLQPVQTVRQAGGYLQGLSEAQQQRDAADRLLAQQSERALQVEQLALENQRLRQLLDMRARVVTASVGAQVLYAAADPYARRVTIDRGQTHGIQPGAPVIDDQGVFGQVTRVYPLVSEVTLLIDRDQAIPVLNTRTGVRSVAFGQAGPEGDALELRYTLANVDIVEGDLLTTSGIDGVYPPGLPVARVAHVGPRGESAFSRILCTPLARVHGALHVLVLEPVGESQAVPAMAPPPAATPPSEPVIRRQP
jgi:rod shape-determining protein MreC